MLLPSSNRKYQPHPLLSYFSVVVCMRCLLHHMLSLIASSFRVNRDFKCHYCCAIYGEFKLSDTFWLADRIRLFVQNTISLLDNELACQIYFVECVSEIKHILSVIHDTIYGAVCVQFTHLPCDDWENIYFVLLSSNRKYELLPTV